MEVDVEIEIDIEIAFTLKLTLAVHACLSYGDDDDYTDDNGKNPLQTPVHFTQFQPF